MSESGSVVASAVVCHSECNDFVTVNTTTHLFVVEVFFVVFGVGVLVRLCEMHMQ